MLIVKILPGNVLVILCMEYVSLEDGNNEGNNGGNNGGNHAMNSKTACKQPYKCI